MLSIVAVSEILAYSPSQMVPLGFPEAKRERGALTIVSKTVAVPATVSGEHLPIYSTGM